jgi:hypothetical protein
VSWQLRQQILTALQNYKKKPIQMYNPHKAPLLDHYRYVIVRYGEIVSNWTQIVS